MRLTAMILSLSRLPRLCLLVLLLALACAAVIGYVKLDRWQRQTIFSVELGEHRWWREPPDSTEVFDIALPGQQTIRAWYWQHPTAAAPTVLYLHGSRWNLNGSVFRMERWRDMGFSILAIDYRGFGASTALLPSQHSVLADGRAALQELARRQPDPALRFIYGHSLGGAIAAQLAIQADIPPVAGIILESTFTNMREMIGTTRWKDVPGLALLVTQPFDSIDAVARIRTPLLLLHGTADQVVPHVMSERLFAAARRVPQNLRELVKIEGASHSGASRSGRAYDEPILAFTANASAAYRAWPGCDTAEITAKIGC